RMVAVLHDTIEDTGLTAEELRAEGFSDEVVAGVVAVTHTKGESYADYVVRCSRLEAARQVKLGDLEDNCRLDRTILRPHLLERDFQRIHRYVLSYKFLTGQFTEAQYRAAMAGQP